MSAGSSQAQVVVREYQADAPAGLIGEWLEERGIPWRVSRPAEERELPQASAIIALGSSASAYWSEPDWIPRECRLLGDAAREGRAVLGICFGAQALAAGLGGEVGPASTPEVGWVRPVDGPAPMTGPFLAWHFDSIALPPGVRAIARTDAATQAYSSGRSMGWQFHPEVTPEIWRDWGDHDPPALLAQVPDPGGLSEEVARDAPATRQRAYALFDWWRAWLEGAF